MCIPNAAEKLSKNFDGLKMQMEVQRINVTVVSGSEVMDSVNINDILDQAESPEQTLQSNPSLQDAATESEISTTP